MPKITGTRMYQVRSCGHCVCLECGRNFNTLNLLKLHKKVKHANGTPAQCPHCNRSFTDPREMTKHLNKYYNIVKK